MKKQTVVYNSNSGTHTPHTAGVISGRVVLHFFLIFGLKKFVVSIIIFIFV